MAAPPAESVSSATRVALALTDQAELAVARERLTGVPGIELVDADAAVTVSDQPLDGDSSVLLGVWIAVAPQRHDLFELSTQELAAAFSSAVRDWRDLGGGEQPIRVVIPREDAAALGRVLDVQQWAREALIVPASEVLETVRGTPGAMGLLRSRDLRPGVLPLVIAGYDPLRDPETQSPLRLVRWISAPSAAARVQTLTALKWLPLTSRDPLGLVATGEYLPVWCTVQAVEIFAKGDLRAIFDRIGDHLRAADLTVVSMEPSATDRLGFTPCIDVMTQGVLTAPPASVTALATAGVDVVSTASNHAGDCHGGCPWPDAIQDTLARLDTAGLAHAGTGSTQTAARAPALLQRDGVRLAFLSYDQIAPWYWATTDAPGSAPFDLTTLAADIKAARRRADHVIVAFH